MRFVTVVSLAFISAFIRVDAVRATENVVVKPYCDEKKDDRLVAGLKLHELSQKACLTEEDPCIQLASVRRIRSIWEGSNLSHASHDRTIAILTLPSGKYCVSCTASIDDPTCEDGIAYKGTHAHPCHAQQCREETNVGVPSFQFQPVLLGVFTWFDSSSSWLSSIGGGIGCAACKVGMITMGVAAQVAFDASGEGEVESAALLTTGAALKIAAATQKVSLRTLAETNPVMRTAIDSVARIIAGILVSMRIIPMSLSDFQACLTDYFLDTIDSIVVTAGQGLVPAAMNLAADVICCNSQRCKNIPKPDPIPPDEPDKEMHPRAVQRLQDARAKGQTDAKETAAKEMDEVLWKKTLAATSDSGNAFCTMDPAPPYVKDDESPEGEEQNENRIDWTACKCQYYCWLWKQSATPKGFDESCENLILQGTWASAEAGVCPGSWWRDLEGPLNEQVPYIYTNLLASVKSARSAEVNEALTSISEKVQIGYDTAPHLNVVLSFGGRTSDVYSRRGTKIPHFVQAKDVGFKRAICLKQLLTHYHAGNPVEENFVYIDKFALEGLEGSYYDTNGIQRNIYWAQYYKAAMHRSKLMIFLIDKAWRSSSNCFQELAWAQGMDLCDDSAGTESISFCPLQETDYEMDPRMNFPNSDKRIIIAYLGGKPPKQNTIRGFGPFSSQFATIPEGAIEINLPELGCNDCMEEQLQLILSKVRDFNMPSFPHIDRQPIECQIEEREE